MNKNLDIRISNKDLALDICTFFLKYEARLHEAFGWADKTKDAYHKYISMLSPHAEGMSLSDSDHTDFWNAIRQLNERKKGKPYAENTLKGIQSIISDICYFAEKYSGGKYRNTLWGTGWNADLFQGNKKKRRKTSLEEVIEKRLKLPRSLSIPEEIKFIDIVSSRILFSSFYLGMAIMFYMGLRPGECCALRYGDIRPLDGHPEVRCLYVYEQIRSTREVTNRLKTSNAYRILPIPNELDSLIQRREEYLIRQLPHGSDLSEYRILCDDNDPLLDCNPKKFMKLCKDTLRDCAVKESVLNELTKLIQTESENGESSPTSYLLRRNFATALSAVCGMEDDEIKYEIGHALYLMEERRSDFLNPDKLFDLWKKLNRRRYFSQHPGSFAVENEMQNIHQREASIHITKQLLELYSNGILVKIWNDYPNDYIRIQVKDGKLKDSLMSVIQEPVPLKKAIRVKIHREFSTAVSQSRNRSEGKKKNKTAASSDKEADQLARSKVAAV